MGLNFSTDIAGPLGLLFVELVREFRSGLQAANSISLFVKIFAVNTRLRPDFIGIEGH